MCVFFFFFFFSPSQLRRLDFARKIDSNAAHFTVAKQREKHGEKTGGRGGGRGGGGGRGEGGGKTNRTQQSATGRITLLINGAKILPDTRE